MTSVFAGMHRFWTGPAAAGPPGIARARGMHVWDSAGKRYIDVTSGPITVNIGHGNEHVLAAMREQAGRVCFACARIFESEPGTQLSQLLASIHGPGLHSPIYVSACSV